MALYVKNKLVSSTVDQFIINGGETLTELVNRTSMPEVLHDYLRVSIDGVVITKAEWERTKAYPQNVVFVAVVPQGDSGGGKNPLASLAMLALAYFSFGAGFAWGSVMTESAIGGALVAGGIMFVGMLAINALFPPPSMNSKSYEDDSGFTGIEGLRNKPRPHGAVRSIYGTYKVAPDIAVEPYIITTGDVQTIFAVYDFGYGYVDLSNILIGNTPISAFGGMSYKIHTQYTNEALEWYKNDNITESFSEEIKNDWVIRTTATECDAAIVNVSFPLGLAVYWDEGGIGKETANFAIYAQDNLIADAPLLHVDITTSHAIARPTLYATYARIFNLHIHIDGSPGYSLRNETDTFTMSSTGTTSRLSTPPSPRAIAAGQSFTIDGVIYTIESSTFASRTRYDFRVYDDLYDTYVINYYYIDTYNTVLDKVMDPGLPVFDVWARVCTEIVPDYVQCVYKYVSLTETNFVSLTSLSVSVFSLTRAMSKAFTFSIDCKFAYSSEWNIYIRRTDGLNYIKTAAWTTKYIDKTVLASVQTITLRDPLSFRVGHTILELQARATDKLSGIVDTLSADCRRYLNYWTGAEWLQKYTSNPAWIALDILMGEANPDPIPESRIDLTAFLNWAIFCDTASSQGDDYYHADCNWAGTSTVFERLVSVFAAGRATISTRENKYSVIYEQFPTVPTQLFTNKNSWNFSGSKVFTKQPHAINVSFIDPLSEWQMVEEIVYADGYDELTATYFENISLPLCTRQEQAWRDGRYYLAVGKLRPESFTFTTDIENLISERGDLIHVAHDVARIGGTPTRVTGFAAKGAELVLNGDFTTNTDNWTGYNDALLSVVSQSLRVTNGDVNYGVAAQSLTTETGKTYILTADYVTDGTVGGAFELIVGTNAGNNDLGSVLLTGVGSFNVIFAATGISSFVSLLSGSNVVSEYSDYDNITCNEAFSVTLKEPVSWDNVDDWYLRIRFEDGTQDEIQVIGQLDPYTIYLASSPAIAVGDLVVYGKVNFVTDEFLIKSISPSTDLTATLEVVPVAREIVNADTGTIPDYTPAISSNDMLYPVCLPPLKISTLLYYTNRFPFVNVELSWESIGTNVLYEVWKTEASEEENFILLATTKETNYKLYNEKSTLDADYSSDGEIAVKVIPVNAFGFKPAFESCLATPMVLPYDTTAPGKPLFLSINVNYDTVILNWVPPVSEDIAGYILKYTPELTTPLWSEATTQGNLIPFNVTTTNVNARIGSYMLKTIDTSGNMSDDYALVKTTIPALSGFDNFETVTEHPSFSGTMTNVEFVTDGIRLVQDGGNYVTYGVYDYASIVDLGDVYNSYITSSMLATIVNSGSETIPETAQDVIIQISMSSENPSMADWDDLTNLLADVVTLSSASESDWSGWQNLVAGYYTGRYFQFRAVLVSTHVDITPHVTELTAKVDMVERTDAQNNLLCNATTTSVSFNFTFKDIPSIAISQDNASDGDYYVITNQSVSGFDIEFFNGSTSIVTNFDYAAIGYGILLTSIDKPIEQGDDDDIALLPEAVTFISRNLLLS